jgi:hypothetical protein
VEQEEAVIARQRRGKHVSAAKYEHAIIKELLLSDRTWGSVDGIVTGYRLDDLGVGVPSPGRVKNFLFFMSSRPVLGSTQPPTQWTLGVLSQGVKRLGCEADYSPPASAWVKKVWIYTATLPYTFMA